MAYALKIMISSRCENKIPFSDGEVKLTDFRKEIKKEIEAEKLFGENVFEVWINDGDAAAAAADETSWEHCLSQAEESEVFISLYDGDAGWAAGQGDIGICHAELEGALKTGRSKVRVIKLPQSKDSTDPKRKQRNKLFSDFLIEGNFFRGSDIKTKKDAKERVKRTIYEAILELSRRGKMHSRKDKFDRGDALKWNRMNFLDRKRAIELVVEENLKLKLNADFKNGLAFIKIAKEKILFQVSSIPGAFTVPAARELVGRPHLEDHKLFSVLSKNRAFGPIHIIPCHRGITETQALSLLGVPDALTIKSGFGVYAADNVLKSQLVFLEHCRDTTSARHMTQLFFEWLKLSGEDGLLVKRAKERERILKTIANQHDK